MIKKSNFFILPEGEFVRPFMICGVSATDTGVAIVDAANKMLGFIDVDPELYDAKSAKAHIVKLIMERLEKKGAVEPINWDNVFTTFKL
jgi:hypothetical protein